MEKNTELSELKINPSILMLNGYQKFSDSMKLHSAGYMGSYQKRFDDDKGRMFFINFSFSDFHQEDFMKHQLPDVRYCWVAEVQFQTVEDDLTVSINLSSSKKSLSQLEDFVKKMFFKMDFQYEDYGYQGLTHERHLEQVEIKNEQISLQGALSHVSETPAKTLKI